MRPSSIAWSPIVLLVLAAACTSENASEPSRSVGGRASASGGAGAEVGGRNFAGSGTVSGGDSLMGGGAAVGGKHLAGSGAAAGEGIGATAGDANVAGSGTVSGGSSSAGSGTVSGGSSSAGSGAAIGGRNSAGSGTVIGGSSSAGSGNASGTFTGGNSPVGSGGAAGSEGTAKALPATTFVFERRVASDRDHLVAMDVVTREQRTIATLADGSVQGWKIDGMTVSPDRTRIVFASLFGPTAADTATGLATNRLWSIDTDGGDFLRLTPVFPNTHVGQTGWRIDVRDPAYSPDGQYIVFDYGEGDFQSGYVAPWVTAADASSLPSLIDTKLDCSVNNNAAFNPVTGDLLLEHVVCIGGTNGGFYLYPSAGGAPDYLVNENGVSISSEPPAFSSDGSLFVYTARTYSDNIQSLYAYIMSERRVVNLVPGAVDTDIVNATFSPGDRYMVYCIKQGSAYNLRAIDFDVDPPIDSELTNDGVSCDAVF